MLVYGYHTVFSTYGFWLPNDPRGSWSTEVWSEELQQFGPATTTNVPCSVARAPHAVTVRKEAKKHLKLPPVRFSDRQRIAVARGFEKIVERLRLFVHACAVMPDHVHLILTQTQMPIEKIVGFLKRAASRELTSTGLHPFARFARPDGTCPTPWVLGGWNRFLGTTERIRAAVRYVEQNPVRIGLGSQNWTWVTPYDGASTSRRRDG